MNLDEIFILRAAAEALTTKRVQRWLAFRQTNLLQLLNAELSDAERFAKSFAVANAEFSDVERSAKSLEGAKAEISVLLNLLRLLK